MDPFNMTGLASNPGDTSQLQASINQLAPMATSFHGPLNPSVAYVAPSIASPSGFLPKLTHFIGGVATGVGHIGVAAGKWLATTTVHGVEAPLKYGAGIAHGWLDRSTINEVNSQRNQLSGRMDTLNALFKSGRIDAKQFKSGLDELNQDLNNLSRQATSLDNQVKIDQVNTQKAAIDTAADVVTILTAGFGKAGSVALTGDGLIPQQLHTAADWLASKGMDVTFKPLETALNKIAIDGQTFSKLTPEVQTALQKSTAEVMANTTSALSAGQIARASAVNIALKYPIYFSYLSGTGEQVYHEMATGDDKGALKTLGFNAALLLSGGPIGYALKWGGKAASAATGAMFGKTSFWDELSKFYGKDAVDIKAKNAGAPTGDFRQAVDQIRQAVENPGANQDFINGLTKESQAHLASFTPDTFNEFVKNLSATEATNMGAVGGHDAVASAFRVAQGMINQRGFNDLTHISHAEGLLDMSRMAKWQREADAMGKAKGKGPLTVGVFDARTVENLAKSNVVEGRSFAERDGNWEAWKQANSSYAAANNPNVDKQMKNINKLRSLKSRQEAVSAINAQQTAFRANELTRGEMATLKQMSNEGYVIIKPANIEAPFKEGTGKLTSAFTTEGVPASKPNVPEVGIGAKQETGNTLYPTYEPKPIPFKDGLPDLYKVQDNLTEHSFPSNMTGTKIENVGDIFRELSKSRGADFGKGYIATKLEKLKRGFEVGKGDGFGSMKNDIPDITEGRDSTKYNAQMDAWHQRLNQQEQLTLRHPDTPLRAAQLKTIELQRDVAEWYRNPSANYGDIPAKITALEKQIKDLKPEPAPSVTQPTQGAVETKAIDTQEFFVRASQPLPVLGHMGGVLTKMGLSPEASAQQVYQVLNENLAKNLEDLSVAKTITDKLSNNGEKKLTGNVTDYILKKLQQTKTKIPVRDYRMYTSKQIQEALDISRSDAIDVQNAIARSFIQTPMAIRGLGDRLVDATYATRPTRAFMSRFTKLQGALRFAWNPFFTLGRLPFKTEALTEAEGGGFIRSVFTGRVGEINKIRDFLRTSGHLNETGNFGVLSGEAVDMAGTVGSLGRDVTPLEEAGGVKEDVQANLGKKLTPMQERSIAGLIDSQATRMGTDWRTYIQQEPQAVRDTVQMIAEYDKKSNFINSPLARTLNIAIFPFRFDVKVATIFARNLGKADLLTQVAVVNGLLKANQWMNSTEGQQWYAQNADAIGLFKYLTPVASLNEVFKSLLPGHDHHLGNFGELGGLPFGWIPQLTDAEGWTQFNAPGVDAKTGEDFPKYIPADQKAQASIAIQDLVGALYSYPGAELGLPSKSEANRKIGNALTESSNKDFTKVSVPLNIAQQDYATNVSDMGNTSITQLPAQGPAPGLAVPAAPPPAPLPRKPAGSGSSSSRSPRKKKADFTPQLLPGQSALGQL